MLDGNDQQTFYSVRELYDLAQSGKKPILFWVGAGVSSWCGYPRWEELSENIANNFKKYEKNFNDKRDLLNNLLEQGDYPRFFQECKNINKSRYYDTLIKNFRPLKRISPVYDRFITNILSINPLYIVTTNIDECLEKNLPNVETLQRTDLPRCIDNLNAKQPFICKIHGSISAVESVIITSDDYSQLLSYDSYKELIRHIFNDCIVLFIGYGLGDHYVLKLLSQCVELKNIFGDGPHFAILPNNISDVPDNVKTIRYLPEPHTDHRSAIQIVEEIRCALNTKIMRSAIGSDFTKHDKMISAHLISDIYPAGIWSSSHTIGLIGPDGKERQAIIGHGIDQSELPLNLSTAMHDLIVGLVCFDKVYAPISSLGRTHSLLGADLFWELVKNNCLEFIQWEEQQAIFYTHPEEVAGGELCSFEIYDKDKRSRTIQDIIKKQIYPVPGKEKEANELFQLLEGKTVLINRFDEPNIPRMVKGLLLRPSLRAVLGISDGVSLNSLPRWIRFPVLRLANVVKIGTTCQQLGIASVKLEFGMDGLVGPAFALSSGMEVADNVTSYVLSGRYNTNIAKYVRDNPSTLKTILVFRDSMAGLELRKEIIHQLSCGYGSDFVSAVNASLKAALPSAALQNAHDQFMGLLLANQLGAGMTPAIWNYQNYANIALSLWRKRSHHEFNTYCLQNHIGPYDLCPCGSGDKVRFCCEMALK